MALEIEEIDEKEFDNIVAEKRHKEMINSLKLMLVELQKDNKDYIVRAAIEKLPDIINKFVSEASKPVVPPDVKVEVETNQDKVVSSVEKMCAQILKELGLLIDAVESTPVIDKYEWTFDRGPNNLIYKATAKIIYNT